MFAAHLDISFRRSFILTEGERRDSRAFFNSDKRECWHDHATRGQPDHRKRDIPSILGQHASCYSNASAMGNSVNVSLTVPPATYGSHTSNDK